MNSRKGFTLIELLVVMAIVSILASFIFPALSRARRKAIQVSCINNLRQLGIALQVYSLDWNGRFPKANDSPDPDSSSHDESFCLMKDVYLSDDDVYMCPATGHDADGNLSTDYFYRENLSAFSSSSLLLAVDDVIYNDGSSSYDGGMSLSIGPPSGGGGTPTISDAQHPTPKGWDVLYVDGHVEAVDEGTLSSLLASSASS